jgi:phosphoglycerate dehydrogenase-like enzyme
MAAERQRLSAWVEVLGMHEDAEVIVVTSKNPIGEAELARMPSARLVLTTTSGYDHLDLPALQARGIRAGRSPLARRDAVVDAALGMLLHGLRAFGPLRAAAREGRWARRELPHLGMRQLRDSRIGVVGLGVIGRRMAAVLQALGAEVVGHDPAGLPDGVPAMSPVRMLQECDGLTLHCRLEPGSAGLLGAAELAQSNPRLVLVNTARGDVLDARAAVARLAAGGLHALGLDVFPVEPWPELDRVRGLPGYLALPHAAGYHDRLSELVSDELCAAVEAWVSGRPLPHGLEAAGVGCQRGL